MHRPLILLIAAFALSAGAQAQSPQDVIVVTASRMASYERDTPPHVTLVRRADAMAMTVTLECDTRDLSDRQNELRATLRNLYRAAERDDAFDLGVIVELNDAGDQHVVPFTSAMVDVVPLTGGARVDTSRLSISIVSDIQPGEEFRAVTNRFDRFLAGVSMVGRSQFLAGRETNLTITGGPARYRDELIARIAEDARRTAAVFGEGSGARLTGLEGSMRWQQSAPLSLTLYIDYELSVLPN